MVGCTGAGCVVAVGCGGGVGCTGATGCRGGLGCGVLVGWGAITGCCAGAGCCTGAGCGVSVACGAVVDVVAGVAVASLMDVAPACGVSVGIMDRLTVGCAPTVEMGWGVDRMVGVFTATGGSDRIVDVPAVDELLAVPSEGVSGTTPALPAATVSVALTVRGCSMMLRPNVALSTATTTTRSRRPPSAIARRLC